MMGHANLSLLILNLLKIKNPIISFIFFMMDMWIYLILSLMLLNPNYYKNQIYENKESMDEILLQRQQSFMTIQMME